MECCGEAGLVLVVLLLLVMLMLLFVVCLFEPMPTRLRNDIVVQWFSGSVYEIQTDRNI
jgi:hypothetical protein